MKRKVLTFLVAFGLFAGVYGADITNNISPSAPDNPLTSVLEIACEKGNLNQVEVLIDQGAPVNGTTGKYRFTPLILSATRNVDVLKYLIAHGAQLDATDSEGNTALNHAVFFNKRENALALLNAGANPNLANQDKRTPLMNAARNGNDDLVTALLAHHAVVNANGPQGSAIWRAVTKDRIGAVKLLIEAHANLNLKSDRAADPKYPRITLLSGAVVTNDRDMIDLLLAHGADLNGKGEDGTTPLLSAIGSAEGNTVLYLLDKGADVDAADNSGTTPLMEATFCQDVPTVQALLQHGAKLETTDLEGRTALMYACRHAVTPAVQILVDQGALLNAVDADGDTAVTFAGDRGKVELVEYLKSKGAKPQDFHIIAKDEPAQPLSAEHSWSLAVAAIYIQWNGESHLLLGGGDHEGRGARELHDDWDVTDKKSLLRELADLRDHGYRAEFQDEGVKLAAMDDASFNLLLVISRIVQLVDSQPDETTEIKSTRTSYLKWKDKSGLAWDLCRAAYVVDNGFAAQYLNEKEAWDLLTPIARQMQSNFSSWQEMSDNFLDGREIWANKRDPEFEACAKLLLNPKEPNSPWNQNPWKTDLSAN